MSDDSSLVEVLFLFLIVGLGIFVMMRIMIVDSDGDTYCRLKFGEGYEMKYSLGGKNYCQKYNFTTGGRYQRFFDKNEFREWCPRPLFFDISSWKGKCVNVPREYLIRVNEVTS